LAHVLTATEHALGKHAAASVGVFATSAQTGAGLAELKAEIAALAGAFGALPG
jgi:selenocysteine-specific translation elongation factor